MNLFLDISIILLLLATGGWCALVHHRLRALRCDRAEINEFIGALTSATMKAEAMINGLKSISFDAEKRLLRQKDGIRKQADEMARLVEAAHKTQKRLDDALRSSSRMAHGPIPTAGHEPRQDLPAKRTGIQPEAPLPQNKTAERSSLAKRLAHAVKESDDPNGQPTGKKQALFEALQALQ